MEDAEKVILKDHVLINVENVYGMILSNKQNVVISFCRN